MSIVYVGLDLGSSNFDKTRARDAGAQGYLVKPVSGDQLIAEVVRIIAESKITVPVAVPPSDQTQRVKTVRE